MCSSAIRWCSCWRRWPWADGASVTYSRLVRDDRDALARNLVGGGIQFAVQLDVAVNRSLAIAGGRIKDLLQRDIPAGIQPQGDLLKGVLHGRVFADQDELFRFY